MDMKIAGVGLANLFTIAIFTIMIIILIKVVLTKYPVKGLTEVVQTI